MKNYNSKIFWHFTGSPKGIDWKKVTRPRDILQAEHHKTTDEAIDILKSILQTKKLKATCTEKVYGNRVTEKFCCVTDIPLSHLDNHKDFYGDVAIGFKSTRIYSEFNPVLYISGSAVARNAVQVNSSTEQMRDLSQLEIDEDTALRSGYEKLEDGTWVVPVTEISYAEKTTQLEKYLLNHLKITTFDDSPGESFYQEKEWRKLCDFIFEIEDVEAILLPREKIAEMNRFLSLNCQPNNISVFSWDIVMKS